MLKFVSLLSLSAALSLSAGEPTAPATTPEKPAAASTHVKIEVRGEYRYITADGIPDHEPGKFPNPGNPNTISPQKYEFRVALHPKANEKPTRNRMNAFGVALNGVPFDPGTAEFWNGNREWVFEALTGGLNLGLDANNAHVQPNGAYHYHSLPTGLIDKISVDKQKMVLVGYASDGFPIYSQYGYNDPKDLKSGVRKMKSGYKLKEGDRSEGAPPGKMDGKFFQDYEWKKENGDLDECNGREGVTPEYPEGIYHYYITEEFPFISRMVKGEPDPSFKKGPPPGGGRGPRRGPPPGGPGGPGGPGFPPPPPPPQ